MSGCVDDVCREGVTKVDVDNVCQEGVTKVVVDDVCQEGVTKVNLTCECDLVRVVLFVVCQIALPSYLKECRPS